MRNAIKSPGCNRGEMKARSSALRFHLTTVVSVMESQVACYVILSIFWGFILYLGMEALT
jgi:hypothetical protein